MVPIMPYVEEPSSHSSTWLDSQDPQQAPYEYHPNLDVETLVFIACNNLRTKRQTLAERKGCYNCGDDDHWQKECQLKKQPQFEFI